MGIFHPRSWMGKLATHVPIWTASRMAPSVLMARNDWLYGLDVTNRAQSSG